ncbi:nucleolar and spindle-associated protein 1 [Sphaerodactylus townsendi]|uniref:Uncharacterized protein n=1 Tax=Sphaerodactylus townsendi TaxID=933632 RepID=A0ACB8G4C5_9SAUR|nr:nucleolar and spindle-associated protein 1 [Sphaerodactylus townsendi]
MEAVSLQQLETLKYSELQRLAKGAGLKANLKTDKLLKVLKQHFYELTQENVNTVNESGSSSSTNAEEPDSSQTSLNVTFVIQNHTKGDGDQGDPEENAIHEENPECCPEKEISSELKESEKPKDAGSERTLKKNQPERLTTSGISNNVPTESQCKERICTKRGRTESKSLVDPFSRKKLRNTTNLPKHVKTGFASLTPNFKKMHEAQFKKMLSIDDYIERKTKRIKNNSNSVEVKMVAKKSNYLKTSQKKTPNSNSKTSFSLLSPHPHGNNRVTTCTPANLRRSPRCSVSNGNKSILIRKSAFNSTGFSAMKTNVRFSETTKDNEHKRSLIKTPSRKSPFLNMFTPDNQRNWMSVSRKDFGGSTTKCLLTESDSAVIHKFEGSTAEPTSTKKPSFDLKASLSRPLGYQPHKGKLKPWSSAKENIQRNYKQPVPTTREERRERHEEGRKLRKDKAFGIRRGLTLAV